MSRRYLCNYGGGQLGLDHSLDLGKGEKIFMKKPDGGAQFFVQMMANNELKILFAIMMEVNSTLTTLRFLVKTKRLL